MNAYYKRTPFKHDSQQPWKRFHLRTLWSSLEDIYLKQSPLFIENLLISGESSQNPQFNPQLLNTFSAESTITE